MTTSALVDLADVRLDELLSAAGDSNLAAAIRRVQDEADADDRPDGISAFNSAF